MIIAERIGSSGNQTHLIDSSEALANKRDELVEKLGPDALVIVSAFLDGPALGAAAVICNGKPWMSPTSVMFTEFPVAPCTVLITPEATMRRIGRFPGKSAENRGSHSENRRVDSRGGLSGNIRRRFHRHNDEPYALELNPRVPGNHATDDRTRGNPEHDAHHHILAFGRILEAGRRSRRASGFARRPQPAGFIRLSAFDTKHETFESTNRPLSGSWNLRHQQRRGAEIHPARLSSGRCSRQNEVLVTCSPASKGTIVEPRGTFCKLEGVSSIYEGGGKQISADAQDMIDTFTRLLALFSCLGHGEIGK